jgi:glycosyltransferase involved in cell wall biosynthesis
LTQRLWAEGEDPSYDGVRVIPAGPGLTYYGQARRRTIQPVVFGLGVLRHLIRHGREYDVVHTASFPFFQLLAAGALQRRNGYRVIVDWHEVWTRGYWREYAGGLLGRLGWLIQEWCLRIPQRAFCFSQLHARRLREYGVHGGVTVLEGEFEGTPAAAAGRAEPVVVFAGRHIPEKRPSAVVAAVARAREAIPDLRGEIYGEGPIRVDVLRAISAARLEGVVTAPGFVDAAVVEDALGRALCLLLPSRREGYGLVVLEAMSRGTPAIVVAGEDNAAVELVEEGVNGFVAPSAGADELAAAIARVHEGGQELRESTLAWFQKIATRLSLESSLELVVGAYRDA